MKNIRTLGLALATGAALIVPCALEAQDPPQPPPQPPPDTELVFNREVFQYPSFTRRNPFRPLLAAEGGPRFEQLSLIGVVYSNNPAESVAVLSTGGVTMNEDGTMSPVEGDAYYVKAGERVGNVTVRQILRDRVEVTVTEFDEQISRTMVFASRRQGGTP
jgi:hypothetical protein